MAKRPKDNSKKRELSKAGFTKIEVSGYKSLLHKCTIEIRPLTILAGANSSGKSSVMQPLLMLKQTLEASYDPGPLMLDGPNVRFTSAKQILSRSPGRKRTDSFSVGMSVRGPLSLTNTYTKHPEEALALKGMTYEYEEEKTTWRPEMTSEEVTESLPESFRKLRKAFLESGEGTTHWALTRKRCFLGAELWRSTKKREFVVAAFTPSIPFESGIRSLIHVPGLRGNPKRTYKTTAVGSEFPGTFENYVASVVHHWQASNDSRLAKLESALRTLSLTTRIKADQMDDTQVELLVGRLPRMTKRQSSDLVSIADAGFGISQTLPVLIALLTAKPGQMVFIEQPEIHLHPKAQCALAQILAQAAQRGVVVVVETHSALLLLSLQALVAEGNLPRELVKLHWFQRDKTGMTKVTSADLDEAGAFGDWPEDFADVALAAESRFLDAAESRLGAR